MGYSITTPCKSAKARDQVVAFLERHHRPFSQVLQDDAEAMDVLGRHSRVWVGARKEDIYDPTRFIVYGDGIAYGAGANKVGFNFSFSGSYGQWMYGLACWIALRAGRVRSFKRLLGNPNTYPYYTYDDEATPVLVAADLVDWQGEELVEVERRYCCDAVGFRKSDPFWDHPDPDNPIVVAERACAAAVDKVVQAELARLDSLWRAANP